MKLSIETAVPVLSKRNVDKLVETIGNLKPSLVVEFGSGASTMFFLKHLSKLGGGRFVSVENTRDWFEFICGLVQNSYGPGELLKTHWTMDDYRKFYSGGEEPFTKIVNGESRYDRWTRIIKAGPFWRFVPDSKSRLALNSGLASLVLPVCYSLTHLFRKSNYFRHYDASLQVDCGNVALNYILVSPGMKDQFGESPIREKYANAWKPYVRDAKSILFMIDGGPRHYIVDQIDLFHKKNPDVEITIALFDAYRPEYACILERFENGCFYKGSVELLNGERFYKNEPEKELWIARLGQGINSH